MLKITKSKIRITGNYNIIFSALLLFTLLFQMEVSAQDPSEKNTTKNVVTRSEFMIKSTSTDKEIYDKVDILNNDFALLLKFKKITRNKNNEIKKIKIILSDEKGTKKEYNVSDSDPIKPFTIFVDSEEKRVLTFGFGDARASLLVDENIENQRRADSLVTIENETAVAEKERKSNDETISDETSTGTDDISIIKQDKVIDYTKAFISLDGKEISAAELDEIDPETIGSVRRFIDQKNHNLVVQYGEKARNGVILMETMFVLKPLTSADIKKLPNTFKLNAEKGAFIIHKDTQDSDIEFYKKHLGQIGVKLETAEIERSANGTIIAIKIKLEDEIQNIKMKSWTPFKNSNGIENIFVGRYNGKINISTR